MIHAYSLFLITLYCLLVYFTRISNCSLGDNYISYRLCVQKCRLKNCLSQNSGYVPGAREAWYIKILWNCYDDCEYECMWPTVDYFVANGHKVPQFKGKWPFVRWMGMQEPASVIFSLFNLISTLFMYRQFYRAVQTPSSMYWTWTGHAVVAANAWIWSVLFHFRDVPFTERMDYIGASSLIYYTLFALGLRMFVFQHMFVKLTFVIGCSLLFIYHISYLIRSKFDYNYNFDTLIYVGILTGVSTLIWFIWNYSRAKHIKYIAAYVSFVMLIALLEILDFPPFLWTFDAHSLWHLGTIPTPYFLYKYELRYMHFGCIGVVFYPIFHLLTLDSRLKTAVIFEESLIK